MTAAYRLGGKRRAQLCPQGGELGVAPNWQAEQSSACEGNKNCAGIIEK